MLIFSRSQGEPPERPGWSVTGRSAFLSPSEPGAENSPWHIAAGMRFGSAPNTASAARGSDFTSNAKNSHVKTSLPRKRLQQQLKVVISFPALCDSDERAPRPAQPHSLPLAAKLIWRELALCSFLLPKRFPKLLGHGWTSLSDKTTRKKYLKIRKFTWLDFGLPITTLPGAEPREEDSSCDVHWSLSKQARDQCSNNLWTSYPWGSIFHKTTNLFSTQQFSRRTYQKQA